MREVSKLPVAAVLIVGAFLLLAAVFNDDTKPKPEWKEVSGQRLLIQKATPEQERRAAQDEARRNVELSNFSWRKGGFGTVMIASFTLTNRNAFVIKDLQIECRISAKSGTLLGLPTNMLYDVVPAGKSLRVKDFSVGSVSSQAAGASCAVGSVER